MLRKECLKAPTATKLSIPDTYVAAKKADAWREAAVSLEISMVYDGRGGGVRSLSPLLPKQVKRFIKAC